LILNQQGERIMYESTTLRADHEAGPYTLPELPYAEDALAPVISRDTVALHHGKHHRAYVDKLNELVSGTELAEVPLDALVRRTAGDAARSEVFNNAGQAWNHHFYWRSLAPGGRMPPQRLRARIHADFGGFEACRNALVTAATRQFGSGWVWLVLDDGHLQVTGTSNADSPLARGKSTPLLTLDVWEHAYYLDYQNRREEHARAVVERLLDWEFAARNLERA
jgi:Fe-Mn family superoxide dismutase